MLYTKIRMGKITVIKKTRDDLITLRIIILRKLHQDMKGRFCAIYANFLYLKLRRQLRDRLNAKAQKDNRLIHHNYNAQYTLLKYKIVTL